MTKLEELKFIDNFIKEHKDDTYLGPFLKEYRREIATAISLDLPIDIYIRPVQRLA